MHRTGSVLKAGEAVSRRRRPAVETMDSKMLQGYFPGVVGWVTKAHAVYYQRHWGFDARFETQVASELAAFVVSYDPQRDGLWTAWREGRTAGSIAIDGREASTAGARLRWFLVQPELHGAGIGGQLIRTAVGFCRQRGYPRVFLWTFQGLTAARGLYEKFGFMLCEEHDVAQWGQRIREQKYELKLKS